MAKVVLPEHIRTLVMQRAAHCCEYCKSQDRFSPVYFTIDHIIPPMLGGTNDPDNLIGTGNTPPLADLPGTQILHGGH